MKRLSLASDAIPRARKLRREMTDAERVLWRGLCEAFQDGHWRSQVPFGVSYTVDFCSHRARLIIEVDGGQHDKQRAHDEARTAFLTSQGYRVIRFWNNEVLQNLGGVLETVGAHLSSPLVGEDQGGGRRASARRKTPAPSESLDGQTTAASTQASPRGGGLE